MSPVKANTQPDLDAMEHKSMARAEYDFLNPHCPQCHCVSIILHTREVRVSKTAISKAQLADYFNRGMFADGKKLYWIDQVVCNECSTVTTFTNEV
jgi:phage FluMu protein Com